jgi:hypothetical protein
MMMNKLDRKKFFNVTIKGIFFTLLGITLPVKFISAKNFIRNKIKVEENPNSVKRMNKV